MRKFFFLQISVLFFLSSIQAANRYWVHKVLYDNQFSNSSQLGEWNLVEDNGTGSFTLSANGTAILKMDNADYANRIFSVNGGSARLLALDRTNGRVEINIKAITGGNQRIFVQAQQFDAANSYIGQINILPAQSNTGFFSINFNTISWAAQADKIRFIIGGENYSGQQGTMEFDYFSYSNGNTNWSNAVNWSETSNGTGGASVPGISDTAIFDGAGSSNGSCLLDQNVNVNGLQLGSGYSGNVDMQSYNLTIGSGGVSVLGGGLTSRGNAFINGNFTVASAVFKAPSAMLEFSGNVMLTNMVFNANNGTIKLTGTGTQQIALASNAFYNLITDKPSGSVELLTNITIANSLTLTNGNINTNTNNLTVGTGTGNTGTLNYTSGRINGRFSRWYNTTFAGAVMYPLGTAATNANLTISIVTAPSAGGTIAVEFRDNIPEFSNVNFSDGSASITKISSSYWNVTTASLTGGTFSISAANNNLPAYNSISDLHFVNAAGVTGIHVPAGGTTGNPLINRTGLTGGNISQIYYAGVAASQSLPLAWISFDAKKQNNMLVLTWQTSQEINSDHFTVETSVDGIHFDLRGQVTAKGAVSNYYEYTLPLSGVARCYARISSVDRDGKITFAPIRSVQGIAASFSLYPVPAAHTLTFALAVSLPNSALYIYNSNGKKLQEIMITSTISSINITAFPAGVYHACLIDGNNKMIFTQPFMISR